MFPELMIVVAVATANLDSPSFQTRQKAERCLSSFGVLAGAHLFQARQSEIPETRMRVKRLWFNIPDYYARYRIKYYKVICRSDFHFATWEKYNWSLPVNYSTKIFYEMEH